MKARNWLIAWAVLVLVALSGIGYFVYKIDPYFHYHKPDLENYYYPLDNQRSQNDGISRYFDYDAIITGTSMTENFKTSEMDEIFGVKSIKVSYGGGTFKEINDNLATALKCNPNLKTIVRGLDYGYLLDDKNRLREDLGEYPTYLYDSNPFNDVKYLYNKDIIFKRAYIMTLQKKMDGFTPGILSFDEYGRWHHYFTYGTKTVLPEGITVKEPKKTVYLKDEERERIYGNITENVTSLADKYPDVDFYYFFTPYSAAWWSDLKSKGTLYKQIEAEEYVIELILDHPNIHLFSINNRSDIVTDLNNYEDIYHYAEWINTLMLRLMKDGQYQITSSNYLDYLDAELEFWDSFDFTSLTEQVDYEFDDYCVALLNREIMGVEPVELTDFASGQIYIDDLAGHGYLTFKGMKLADQGRTSILISDDQGNEVGGLTIDNQNIDGEWHQYVINLSGIKGGVTIALVGDSASFELDSMMLY